MQPTSFTNASGLSSSIAPVARTGAESPPFSEGPSGPPLFEKSGPRAIRYPDELRGLIGETGIVRRRILANRSLAYWMAWCNWILAALILAAAFSRQLRGAVIWGAVFIAIAAVASFVLARRQGPSFYGAACQLDAKAGLQDRLPTTIHFATTEEPSWMVLCQRRDALARLTRVNSRALFPLEMPANMRRTAALALLAAGLFAYRIKNGPPALALIQKTAQTHLAEAVISPFVRVIENGPLNVLDRRKPDVLDEEAEAAGMPKQNEKVNPFSAFGQPIGKDSNDFGPQNSPALYPAGPKANQGAARGQDAGRSDRSSSLDSQQQDPEKNSANQNSPNGAKNGNTPGSNQGQQNASGSKGGQQSLGQKLIQALKDMMGNMTGQEANQTPGQSPPDTQAPSAQGQGGQSTEAAGKGAQQSALNNGQAKNTPANSGAHSGAGNGTQPQPAKQTAQDSPQQSNLVPERVPLDASNFRVQTRPRAAPGPGTADVPLTNATPLASATTNGAERENIPLRYRQSVQRYFDQAQK